VEGIESGEALDLVCSLDCDAAQGYIFTPPLPPVQLEEWIMRRQSAPVAARTRGRRS
jgi:EAL domain-containing protein (putative c-di-GMP-specific phosphodiesterase class I)